MSFNVTQNEFNDFNFPPPSGADGPNNSVFTIGDVLNLSWHTQYTQMNLIQKQAANNTGILIASSFLAASHYFQTDLASKSRDGFLCVEGLSR
jgi:hypothetical protein